MTRRSSNSLKAFKRQKKYIGIPANAFYLLLLLGIAIAMFRAWVWMPALIFVWMVMRKLTKHDAEWTSQFEAYTKEKHIYDSLPRAIVWQRVQAGWGKGLPW